jgi:iron complex outermembrane receptor protein
VLLGERQAVWAAFSRAIRTPSPVEHDLALTVLIDPATASFARVMGNRDFRSEIVYASEAGHRIQVSDRLRLSSTAFYNVYRRLLSIEPGAPFVEADPSPTHTVVPFLLDNKLSGRAYGAELAPQWIATSWLQVSATYALLRLDLEQDADSMDPMSVTNMEGSSPRHQGTLRLSLDLPRQIELDSMVRAVDELDTQGVDAYVNLDLRAAWRPLAEVEVTVVGQNLLQRSRQEFAAESPSATRVERGVYGKVTWRW